MKHYHLTDPLEQSHFSEAIIQLLCRGGVGVLRTDTLYGIVGRADNEKAVERIYALKHRTPAKSPIVLIADERQLFDEYDESIRQDIRTFWPGQNSLILPSQHSPIWIRRNNHSVAYRMPHHSELLNLLQRTGPLIAPSANPESLPPAMTIAKAKDYFGINVDFYVDGGEVTDTSPSRLYQLYGEKWQRIR